MAARGAREVGVRVQRGVQLLTAETYASCVEWNNNVVDELLASAPDVVVVSSRATRALADPQDTGSSSNEAMVDARHAVEKADAGIGVVVLWTTRRRPSRCECVGENLTACACAFDRAEAVAVSAALFSWRPRPGWRGADRGHDPDDLPGGTVVPIIGDVLLYRQGSHLTDTYVRTL